MYISVVILCKNEEEFIRDVLDKVYDQKIDKDYEVIVIDSGSQDKSLDIIKKYPLRLIQIGSEYFSHGRTRNYGVRVSKGKYVIFLNADALPIGKNWINNLISGFEKCEDVAAIYSRVYPRKECNPLRKWEILYDSYYNAERIKYMSNFEKYKNSSPEEKRKLISFHTISCVFKKEIISKYPFKEMDFGEDLDWSKRILEEGYKIGYETEASVVHSHNFYNSFTRTLKKYFDDTKLNNMLLKRWKGSNIIMLLLHLFYKLVRDIRFILSLKQSIVYKISWAFYAPVVRFGELCGVVLGNWDFLPVNFQKKFSLVNSIIKE